MEGKTNFPRRLKQFDGLTWLIWPHILRQIYATDWFMGIRPWLSTYHDIFGVTWSKFRPTSLLKTTMSQKQAVPEAATICPRPLQVDLWPFDLKVVSKLPVRRATSVQILIFLGLSVLDLGPMYATDRQTSDAHHRLMPSPYGSGVITNLY